MESLTLYKTLLFAVMGMLLVPTAAASGVSLGVDTDQSGEILLTDRQGTPETPKTVTVEARNTGSTSFTGRIRLDVADEQNRTIFRTWTDVLELTPGAATSHRFLFYRPQYNGTLTASAVLHHGVRRVAQSFTVNSAARNTSDGFNLRRVQVHDDRITAAVAVPEDVDAFAITVDDASTRRFAQRRVQPNGGVTTVDIPYHPAIRDTADATITISSADGRYHYTTRRTLTRQDGAFTRLTGWVAVMLEKLPLT